MTDEVIDFLPRMGLWSAARRQWMEGAGHNIKSSAARVWGTLLFHLPGATQPAPAAACAPQPGLTSALWQPYTSPGQAKGKQRAGSAPRPWGMDDVQATKLHCLSFWRGGRKKKTRKWKIENVWALLPFLCSCVLSGVEGRSELQDVAGIPPASPPVPWERSVRPLPWASQRPMRVPLSGKGRVWSPQGPSQALTQREAEVAPYPRAPACLLGSLVTQAALVRPRLSGPYRGPRAPTGQMRTVGPGRPCYPRDCPSSPSFL
nr:uncharacterized protein LOC107130780 [Macaca fascicularis]